MADERVRLRIAQLAAQLMYERVETEYFTAKRKAAKQLGVEHRFRPKDLPSNREIRDQILLLARMFEGEKRDARLRDMRIEALRLMRKLRAYCPRLIGSVCTGHIRKGSDIDIHIFSDSEAAVSAVLDQEGMEYDLEHKKVRKHGEERVFTHFHVHDRYGFELTLYAEDKIHYVFKSSITGGPIERMGIQELENLLRTEDPAADLDAEVERLEDHIDRFELYRMLLQPLERLKQDPEHHPEGDALYHSLQVFELARRDRPYDEEFLTAALLHDVGKGIDPGDHVGAALAALEGAITPRTEFLIAHHMDALAYREGKLGQRARRRLEESEDFEDLLLLRELDTRGRVSGAFVCEIGEALDYLRSLDAQDEGD